MRNENVTPEAKEFAKAIHDFLQELIDEGEKNTTILNVHGLGSTKDNVKNDLVPPVHKIIGKYYRGTED